MGAAAYVSVPRLWPGETVVCIASGPSLTPEDVAACRGRARVIVVNDNYRLAPWADALYACDLRWWKWHQGVPSFASAKYSVDRHVGPIYRDVRILRNAGNEGLELDPTGLRTGKNSGYQAINLAVHYGAARIVLLGYDLQPGPKGHDHWFGQHPSGYNSNPSLYAQFRKYFATLVAPLRACGIDIVNASRATALTCFRRASLEDALRSADVPAEVAC